MDMFKKRILKPQIATVANRIDADSAQYYTYNTCISLGTAGVQPASYKIFSDARATLALEACPTEGEKNCILDPITMSAATDALKGLFNPQARIGDFNEKGLVAKEFAGLDWWEDQNVMSFTTGTNTGTAASFATLTGASYSNSALLSTGWAASGTLTVQGFTATSPVCTVGDIFTIATVYPVNPQNRRQYGRTLKQFVVLPAGGFGTPPNGAATSGIYFSPAILTNGTFNSANGVYTSDGSGYCTLTIGEAIISGGQFQNCTTAPVSGSAIVFNNSATQGTVSPQGLVFHKYAYALAFADLPLPQGVEMAARAYDDEDVGMSIRMVTQYTINNDSEPTRADVLYGPASLYRSLGIRICG